MMTTSSFQLDRYSLRWRLPVVIVLMVGLVLGTFVWAAGREVARAARQTAGARAAVVAEQIAGSLGQSTRQRLADARRLVSTPAIEGCLRVRTAIACEAAQRAIERLPGSAPQVTELWSRDGARLASISVPPSSADDMPGRGSPPWPAVGPLQRHGDLLYTEAAIDVRQTVPADDGAMAPEQGDLLGYVVSRRPIAATPARDLMNRLTGVGGAIKLGNTAGDVWTDLASAVRAPAIDLTRAGVSRYEAADRTAYLGALSPVQDTPWAVWVEFPEAVVLAPVRAFTIRMIGIGALCLLIAATGVGFLSARFIGPLATLATMSEAIAAGDFARRADTKRRDEVGRLGAAFNTMAERVEAMHRDLEARVVERTASLAEATAQLERRAGELAAANHELEAFSYSVSHDLRAPLRHIHGFGEMLQRATAGALPEKAQRCVDTIMSASAEMGALIDDLLAFSRMGRVELRTRDVALDALVSEAIRAIEMPEGGRQIDWRITPLGGAAGDPSMIRQVLVNLIGNAVKYTRMRERARIEIGCAGEEDGRLIVFVRDNGAGFDPQYAHKLFGVFQRLHRAEDFEGTGIGLAIVRRIVSRHGGRVWAEGAIDQGAAFFFTLQKAVSVPALPERESIAS
jgi:signal transduction histidine kinase